MRMWKTLLHRRTKMTTLTTVYDSTLIQLVLMTNSLIISRSFSLIRRYDISWMYHTIIVISFFCFWLSRAQFNRLITFKGLDPCHLSFFVVVLKAPVVVLKSLVYAVLARTWLRKARRKNATKQMNYLLTKRLLWQKQRRSLMHVISGWIILKWRTVLTLAWLILKRHCVLNCSMCGKFHYCLNNETNLQKMIDDLTEKRMKCLAELDELSQGDKIDKGFGVWGVDVEFMIKLCIC